MVANGWSRVGLCKYNAAFSAQYGGGLCAALSIPWLLDRLCTTNTKLCQHMLTAHLSCTDGKCAYLKVTWGRGGKIEESNEDNKTKESKGECYIKEIFASERR
jgi:hypothetical protein